MLRVSVRPSSRPTACSVRVVNCMLPTGGPAQDPIMRATFFALQLIDGFAGTRNHVGGRLPEFIREAGFSDPVRRGRMRTAWGSLEFLTPTKR